MTSGFAQRIKEAAEEAEGGKGVKPAHIAKAVGATRATVWNWFQGNTVPDGVYLARAAEYLGVRAQWLSEGKLPKRLSQKHYQPNVTDDRSRSILDLASALTPAALELWQRNARDYAALQGLRSPEDDVVADDVGVAMADLRKEGVDLLRAWQKLPDNERHRFKRAIEVASLKHSRPVEDRKLAHLAAPGTPTAVKAAKAKRKATRQ